MGARTAKATIDHDEIRAWVEARGGRPAHVQRTGGADDPAILRIDFPGHSGEGALESISWEEWFEAFDANGLAFLHQDVTTAGEQSHFNELVARDTVAARARGDAKAATSRARHARGERSRPSHP